MHVAWFSALAPELRSAECTRILLGIAPWKVEVFTDEAGLRFTGGLPLVRHFLCAAARHHEEPFDLFVHHLEDAPPASFVRASLGLFPGPVVFHDAAFDALSGGDGLHLIDLNKLCAEEGIKRSEDLPAEFKLAGQPVVTSATAAKYLVDRGVEPALTAHPLRVEPVSEERRQRLRAGFGWSSADKVVVVHGVKLLEDRMGALREAIRSRPGLRWCCAAAGPAEMKQLERRGFPAEVERREVPSLAALRELVSAGDALVALRRDLLHEVPVALLYALGSGVPAISSAFGPADELPSQCVLKIEPGAGEGVKLARALDEVMGNGELRRTLAENGFKYIESVHSPEGVLEDLLGASRAFGGAIAARCEQRFRRVEARKAEMIRALEEETGLSALNEFTE